MGGCCCCCASKAEELNNAPTFYHYPRAGQEHQTLPPSNGTVSSLSTGLLVDTNLDTSIPETYRAPPAPVPYETYVGHSRSSLADPPSHGDKNETVQLAQKAVEETNSGITQETTVKIVKLDGNATVELTATKDVENDLEQSGELKKPGELIVKSLLEEEEDVCPTCLEEYDSENPKIITKCEHHFHLGCILEWMERSDTCPVCDQVMVFSTGDDA
ncbi:probable E3 ubiquitin-protein ligase RHB1A [Coffea eugenioides]|uniref:RING-type E3 ubiquitin transferase n=1 Tax=Coffea arabica TaxID=13443 RepID=A0A6P6TSB8_COFAR|nr:probable E3 ubiquitin-protein ligase RHB1A [Coffea arabica]XP_027081353.1 probable E3 ubiquitin-protein ligase RHB1A [Coffea arabica]XP_027183238.1 probable E3 ubiquitin-protein ligase RHB1A [Coffea eugenioides]